MDKYVDGSFFIIQDHKINDILEFLDNFHPQLKFTMECEQSNRLNFLDTTIIRGKK